MSSAIRSITVLIGVLAAGAVRADAHDRPVTHVDLTTREGLAMVSGAWRYSDTRIVETTFRAPDAEGQPYGEPVRTYDYEPHAGARDFDDSAWPVIEPASLSLRRGNGRLSFNWYRLRLKVPERVGDFDTRGSSIYFETRLDDYAEVWVNGELARPYGGSGGSVVAGWNAQNRVLVARNAQAGQEIQLAIFGMNGPISDTPTNYIYVREARLAFAPGPRGPLAVPAQEVNVQVERLDPAIDAIVPANPKLFKLAEGFLFTEGPVWSRQGLLLFSDPNANTIYSYAEATVAGAAGALSVFRANSGYDAADVAEYGQPGSNGLTFDPRGRLTINEHGRHRVARLDPDGKVTVLADSYRGKRLNSPNDLVYASNGTLYFTDPPFGLPRFYDDPRKELPFSGVYRLKNGRLSLESQVLRGPNGIALSPDERFLYVGNWDPQAKVVLRHPVRADGSLGAAETFIDLTRAIPGEEALDGLKVDRRGNLYLSAPGGIWIFAGDGRHLGTIRAPKPVHNFAWGGDDGRTLYLTARDTLYRIPLLVEGVRP
ncbi:MAG TPA: SMP-30/gluconolactonase/LRE family protein [Steroidobacteraceae bacterium]|nr:SMP-30/gluconolactonase/LRE family protein [Steroidobacteraceae bacterium]